MELHNKAVIIGVNLTDHRQAPSSQHLFTEVVLIDKSSDVLHPLVYQLHSNALDRQEFASELFRPGFVPIEDNAYAMIGEVLAIDKTKKIIHLRNNITVAYRHLIVASGLKQSVLSSSHDEELSAGVHALMEALRVRKNISASLAFPQLNHLGFDRNKKNHYANLLSSTRPAIENVQKLFHPPKPIDLEKSMEMALSGTEKRLYELQL